MLNKYSITTGIRIILSISIILINMGILNWLNNISKCKCVKISNDINFFKISCIIFTLIQIFGLLTFIIYEGDVNIYSNFVIFTYILSFIIVILNLTFLIKLFIFIRTLRKNNCHCGLKHQENLIYYYLILQFILLSLLIALIIAIFIVLFLIKYL